MFIYLLTTVVLKVWVAMGCAKVIQIRQNDFLQDQNFQNLQNFFFFGLLNLSKLLHHPHLVGFIEIE